MSKYLSILLFFCMTLAVWPQGIPVRMDSNSGLLSTNFFKSNVVAGSGATITYDGRGRPTIAASGGGGGSATNAVTKLQTNGVTFLSTSTTLNFSNGANVTVAGTASGTTGTVTIAASGGSGIATQDGNGTNTTLSTFKIVEGTNATIKILNVTSTQTNSAGSASSVPLTLVGAAAGTANLFEVQTNGGGSKFLVSSNGSVGIGTNLPSSFVHLRPHTDSGTGYLRIDQPDGTARVLLGTATGLSGFGALWLGTAAPILNSTTLISDGSDVYLQASSVGSIWMRLAGTDVFRFNTTGLLPSTDNSYDIGSSATRIKKIEIAGTLSSLATNSPSIVTTNNKANGTLFTSTADKGVTNTTTEGTIIGTGQGTLTLPANLLIAGRTIRITISGIFSDDAVTPGTVTVAAKLGATTVATTGAQTPAAAISAGGWKAVVHITCRTTGVSGTVMAHGSFENQGAALAENNWWMVNTGTTTIDTTATQAVDVTWDWGTADTDNSTTGQIGIVEILR